MQSLHRQRRSSFILALQRGAVVQLPTHSGPIRAAPCVCMGCIWRACGHVIANPSVTGLPPGQPPVLLDRANPGFMPSIGRLTFSPELSPGETLSTGGPFPAGFVSNRRHVRGAGFQLARFELTSFLACPLSRRRYRICRKSLGHLRWYRGSVIQRLCISRDHHHRQASITLLAATAQNSIAFARNHASLAERSEL